METDNERWKSDGDCSKCRRNNYCKKKCKAYQKETERLIKQALFEGIAKIYRNEG